MESMNLTSPILVPDRRCAKCGAIDMDSIPPATMTFASPLAICWRPRATDRRPEPQSWFMPHAVFSCGMPAAMAAGIPQEKTAWGMNQLCGSGLRSVALGLQQIANGDAKVIVAGGMESMSMAPHLAHLRSGTKMGDVKFIDSMLKDGLLDAFHGYHMGVTAENIASKWQISRDEQDAFATNSQNKAENAQKAGRFKDEIVPVTVKTRKGDVVVDQDEY